MPRSGAYTRLAPGIYAYPTRIRVIAKVGNRQVEEGFPLGSDLREMQRWQLRAKEKLFDAAPPSKPASGTLARDALTYLSTLTGRRKKDDAALIRHWTIGPLGVLRRKAITRAMVKAQIAAWLEAGVSASSCNHRLRVLRNLYRELDGADEPNPTDAIRKQREPEPENRSQSVALVEAIIAFMPDRGRTAKRGEKRGAYSLGKARARVMLWTGLPPAQLKQVTRSHFDPALGILRVTPRRKGAGTKGTTIPLLPEAVNALRLFFQAGAEGPFSTHSFYKQWMRAQKRLLDALRTQAIERGEDPTAIQLPRRIRPYDLRHTFGAEAYRQSRNLLGVRKLMLHARLSSSERYMEGAVDESATAVVEAWAAGTRPLARTGNT
jgi:integrase